MNKISTSFAGVYIYSRNKFSDNRGHLEKLFMPYAFLDIQFSVDDAYLAISQKADTIRGLHAQKNPFGQYKLVTCTTGQMFDVALDLREDSATFGHVFTHKLDSKKSESVLIPPGFAHGVYSLEDNTTMLSLCSRPYLPEHEFGISMLDLDLDFVRESAVIVSEKDRILPTRKQYFELNSQ
jgi:dTDP-4-dehydrorhamnose 3,5-epimerase